MENLSREPWNTAALQGEDMPRKSLDKFVTTYAQGWGAGGFLPAPLPRGERGVWGNAPRSYVVVFILPRRGSPRRSRDNYAVIV